MVVSQVLWVQKDLCWESLFFGIVSSRRRHACGGGCWLEGGQAKVGGLEDIQPTQWPLGIATWTQTVGQRRMGSICLGIPFGFWPDEIPPTAMRGMWLPHHGVLRGLSLPGGAIPYVSWLWQGPSGMCGLHDGRAHLPVRPGCSRCHVGRRTDGGERHHYGRWGVSSIPRALGDSGCPDPHEERRHVGPRCFAPEDPWPCGEDADAHVMRADGTSFWTQFWWPADSWFWLEPRLDFLWDVTHWMFWMGQ